MDFLDEFIHLRTQLKEIKLATNDFSADNEIGKGGFGKVYKGEISHFKGRSMVAFKRLDRRFGQGDPQFWKEVMMLSRHPHENLISLLGYCDEGDERILMYELASRGSLDHYLSDVALTWRQRLKICLAAARGLSHLHDPKGTKQRVIHRDIKSSNILLDGNWNAKLSDMGLSKLAPANQQHSIILSNVVGTPGYCDPLYMETYTLTKESDMYSFGVVLFEVMCGKLCYEYSSSIQFETLVPMWIESYELKKLDEIIFQDLKQQMDPTSLEKFSDIAYQCLQIPREERPSMARVVKEVELALEYQDIDRVVKEAELALEYQGIDRVVKEAESALEYQDIDRVMKEGELALEYQDIDRVVKEAESALEYQDIDRVMKEGELALEYQDIAEGVLQHEMENLTEIDLKLAYSSKKLLKLESLLSYLLSWENDFEALAADGVPLEFVEKSLTIDVLSSFMYSEVKELHCSMDSIEVDLVDAHQRLSSCKHLEELFSIVERKLLVCKLIISWFC